jgi:NAD(P)-dependent dehydrogenase (short-subunit alcohol dehydrogenase family)
MSSAQTTCIAGLAGQVALVTGSTRGIGRATAEELARYGAALVITGQDPHEATTVALDLGRQYGVPTLAIDANVADRVSVGKLVETLLAWSHGRLDIVVNNAGHPIESHLWDTPFHDMPADKLGEWFRTVADVDVGGARNVTHATLPILMGQRSGAYVFVSSTPALAGHKATPYTVAKAAVLGLMRDIALSYGRYGIRANAIAPGNIRTAWFDRLPPAEQQRLADEPYLKRWGEPLEVAKAILFLASPLSSYVTGQTLVIDGGKVIH